MILNNLGDTENLARTLLRLLPQHTLLILQGPLGAGKTTLCQSIAKGLGFEGQVSSPSYTLIHEYPLSDGLLVHADLYRLSERSAIIDMGLDDYLARATLVLIEWGDVLLEVYPDAYLLDIELLQDGNSADGYQRRAHLFRQGQELSLS